MKMKKYTSPIQLTVLGPFLTAATGVEQYALQKAFHRNHRNEPVIPASHLKGKVRMALEELAAVHEDPDRQLEKINDWLGRASEDNPQEEGYEPAPGLLLFSELTCAAVNGVALVKNAAANPNSAEEKPPLRRRSRIAIHAQAMTAAENQLRDVEEFFKSGAEITFTGKVTFFAENLDEALALTRELQLGLKWLTTMGAEKGVGHGRLKSVHVGVPEAAAPQNPTDNVADLASAAALHLRIQPQEPIMVGGRKSQRTNFVTSQKYLSGGLIKGALAAGLNRGHGIVPFHRELSAQYAADYPGFENLVAHFEEIRITHAFPAPIGAGRPVTFPISIIKVGYETYHDSALNADSFPMHGKQAAQYFIDWKLDPEEAPLEKQFGHGQPDELFVTRTQIESVSRRAQERNLYTYSYYFSPEDKQGNPMLEWVCNVDFSGVADSNIRQQVKVEFAKAVSLYLDRMGKRNSAVAVQLRKERAQPATPAGPLIRDGLILVTLQTDTLMLNPEEVRCLKPGEDLHALYAAFWRELSGGKKDPGQACLELLDFYAHQTFQGGYLYHRYLGSVERQSKPDQYYPYYLTGAGSVFKLRPRDENKAKACLEKWLEGGLDLPQWAKERFGTAETWKTCPFVPQNGFGEIAVNLNWHWDRRL